MSLRDDLKAARLLIATPETWCQGIALRRNVTEDDVVWQHCAVGALQEAIMSIGPAPFDVSSDANRRYAAGCLALDEAARALTGNDEMGVVRVNDEIGHQAVLDVYDRAITLADE